MAKNIMIQGTGSSVGKSIITAGLCRIFLEDGYRVAPFKSQNMALNSFVTNEGLEMGRAQVVQAEACRLEPSVLMNPILIKPTTDKKAQIIVNGKVYKNMDAGIYHEYKKEARAIAEDAYFKLEKDFDIIAIEGAGSPVEINLRDKDIVNMGMAEIADSPVVLVSDIDKGGVFASIVGTIYLLNEEEKKRVKGVIINKFRGDIELLKPGLDMLEDIIKIPVLGVVPYIKMNLEDEDSVTERFKAKSKDGDINIDVIRLPKISNFSDFNVFTMFDDVNLNYVDSADMINEPDIIIMPGSKNPIEDLKALRNTGIVEKIIGLHKKGTLVVGICGGYQMLGNSIEDPHEVEGDTGFIEGLGLIDMKTVLEKEKITRQVKGKIIGSNELLDGLENSEIEGYEIHMGRSISESEYGSFALTDNGIDGSVHNNSIGTYIHGIFDSAEFTRGLLNNIRKKKGLPPIPYHETFHELKEREFKKLADALRESLDIEKIYKIVFS